MSPEAFHESCVPRASALAKLRSDAESPAAPTNEHTLFCFTSDAYQPGATITREALTIMAEHSLPFVVLTKAGDAAQRDFDLYSPGRDAFAVSLCWVSEDRMREHEPNAGSIAGRIAALEAARSRGIDTWVSVEPVVEETQGVDAVRLACKVADEVRIGKLNHVANTTNWHRFANAVADIVCDAGCRYVVKDALRPFWPHGVPYVVR